MENKFLKEREEISNQYDLVGFKDLSNIKQKAVFKDKSLRCRFCGKDGRQTTFKNEAHIFPRFIGNKFAVSKFECDCCNEKFSRILENEFASFMKILHAVNGVRGRKGIPIYNKDGIRLENKNGIDFDLKGIENSSISEKGVLCKLNTDDFIPVAVYKCFVKMALSMVDESELGKFSNTIDWLQDETHSREFYSVENLPLIFTQNKKEWQKFNLSVLLFRRKANNPDIPAYVFKLYYNLFSFQIFIPFCSDDLKNNFKPIEEFKIIPNNFEIENNSEESYRYITDFFFNVKSTFSVDLSIVNLDYSEN